MGAFAVLAALVMGVAAVSQDDGNTMQPSFDGDLAHQHGTKLKIPDFEGEVRAPPDELHPVNDFGKTLPVPVERGAVPRNDYSQPEVQHEPDLQQQVAAAVIPVDATVQAVAEAQAVENTPNAPDPSVEDFPHLFYINLAEREDRNSLLRAELAKIHYPRDRIHRVDAIRKPNGAVGCGLSHIKALETIQEMGLEQAVVIEDDFEWQTSREETIDVLHKAFHNPAFGIMLFTCGPGEDEFGDYEIVWDIGLDYARGVEGCQTTTGYIIRKSYVPDLIYNFRETVARPENDPEDTEAWRIKMNHIDQGWKALQRKDRDLWMATKPYLGWQRAGTSDIEQTETDYYKPWHPDLLAAE